MKKSEIIRKYRDTIATEMVRLYRSVIGSDGAFVTESISGTTVRLGSSKMYRAVTPTMSRIPRRRAYCQPYA